MILTRDTGRRFSRQLEVQGRSSLHGEDLVECLPVVNSQGKLVGIITESDIFRIVSYEWSKTDGEDTISDLEIPIVPASLTP